MLAAQFAQHLKLDPSEVDQLLSLPADRIYDDPLYHDLVRTIDPRVLEKSAHMVRAIYEEQLEEVKVDHNLGGTVMSGYTLVNWVLGFMMYPDRMRDMLPVHASVSPDLVAEMLPHLVTMLNQLPPEGDEWKRALLIFSLPLVAAR